MGTGYQRVDIPHTQELFGAGAWEPENIWEAVCVIQAVRDHDQDDGAQQHPDGPEEPLPIPRAP